MSNPAQIPEGGYSRKFKCYEVFERNEIGIVNNLTSHHLLCVGMGDSIESRIQECYPEWKTNSLEWYFKSEYFSESWL